MTNALEQKLVEGLRAVPDVEFAILFGSLAAGAARRDSDLDLAVDAGRPLTPSEKARLIRELAAQIGRPVDLVDLRTAGGPILRQVVRNGTRVLGTAEQSARLLSRYLVDAADFMPYRERILDERKRGWIGT